MLQATSTLRPCYSRVISGRTDTRIDKLADRHTDVRTDTRTDGQVQADLQAGTQACREMDILTYVGERGGELRLNIKA